MSRELSFELTGGPYAVTAARLALNDIDELVDESVAFDVRLLVSELVTNSVRHAQIGPEDSIELRVTFGDSSVRVEVIDSGPGFEPPEHDPTAELARDSGWGLFFVTQLADRWGVEREQGCVWFEIEREDGEARGQTAA
ncbi:MAG: ATP-binding protein [Actinomycetota bacterium]|nr:ATP-binding protein [Actinomycetota bacterium]